MSKQLSSLYQPCAENGNVILLLCSPACKKRPAADPPRPDVYPASTCHPMCFSSEISVCNVTLYAYHTWGTFLFSSRITSTVVYISFYLQKFYVYLLLLYLHGNVREEKKHEARKYSSCKSCSSRIDIFSSFLTRAPRRLSLYILPLFDFSCKTYFP